MRILFIDDDAVFSNALSEMLEEQNILVDQAECGESGIDEPEMKIIDVFICKLRKKISRETQDAALIETVWGRGYWLNVGAVA